MMRAIIFFLSAILFAAPLSAGQLYQQEVRRTKAETPTRKTTPATFFENKKGLLGDSSIRLSFDFVGNGKFLKKNEALLLRPVYRAGEKCLVLPVVLINGRTREKYYKREVAFLTHEEYMRQKPLIHVVHKGKGQKVINYHAACLLPEGTPKDGVLVVEQYLQNCCNSKLILEERFLADIGRVDVVEPEVPAEEFAPVPEMLRFDLSYVSFVKPEREVRKMRNQRLSLLINFMVNRHDILPDYANNYAELRKVDSLLAPFIRQKELYTLEHAAIRGYASPEDSYEHNMRLSQRRANSFKDYLIANYMLGILANCPAVGMGEDWEGLRKAVEESDMSFKYQVLRLIDEIDLSKGRERMIMNLDGGNVYRYMLRNLYPPLRRMEMEVSYTVNAFDSGQARDIIKTRPQDLSHEEIFSIAQENNRNADDREHFGEEYLLAAKVFPNDALAALNASSALLIRGEFDEAWKYLEPMKDDNRAYNNIALYYWAKQEYEQAEAYFVKAMQMGADQKQTLRNYKLFKQSVR